MTLRSFRFALLALAGIAAPATAQVPRMIDYQGRIAVRDVNFDGVGQFRFALVDGTGTVTYWSHDGTATGGGPPASHISVPVVRGMYSVRLGDTSIPGMAALTPDALDHPDVRLRVWFNDGTTGFQQLSPDRRITAVAYAITAESVPDGSITAAKLAPESVTTDKLAPDAVTGDKLAPDAVTADKLAPGSITGDKLAPGSITPDKLAPGVGGGESSPYAVLFSIHPADPVMLGNGYRAIQTFPAPQWVASPAPQPPSPRMFHTAVWTGSSMIVWGGEVSGVLSGQGGIYSPETDTWSLISQSSVSPPRREAVSVWTGSHMVVWGGRTAAGESATGAVLDPASRTWLATPSAGAPSARVDHTAVWTGTQMVVFGGGNGGGALGDGGIFTPPPAGVLSEANPGSWSPLPLTGSPPSARRGHTAVWCAGRMIVWGGESTDGTALGNGAAWNPETQSWTALPAGGPSPRLGHTAVEATGRMIIFGGAGSHGGAVLADGAVYDPATNAWTPLAAAGSPAARWRHNAVWTGTEMVVTGGETGQGSPVTSAAAYNPATQTWRSLSSPPAAVRQTALWSGQRILTFSTNGLRILDPAPAVTLYGKY